MIRKLIDSLKLTRLSYLLEVIKVRDFRNKIKAFNKIRQMKITKDMGLLILQEIDFEHVDIYSDFNISLSLISLLFKDYYDEYSDKLKDIYPKLTLESKYEVLNLLSNSNNASAIVLYKNLLIKYGKELNEIPVGSLALNKDNYNLLFPDLFKVLKFELKRNPILILLNDFINQGTVKEADIKKNKKILQTSIVNVLKEANNYKFKKDENIMQNKDYINLRIYLEIVTNLEFYVSNKDTKSYLEKLLKKKDNQLKLFILENYIKKGKDISKINLNTIARDNLSRYPLYSFLKFYNLEKLMPKKYCNNKALSESDLYINYCLTYKYESIPEKMEFLKEEIVNNHKYYIYKFETDYNYVEEVKDPATDYILKTTKLDKALSKNKIKYIGISGGFNSVLDPSLVEEPLSNIIIRKYSDDYESILDELLPKKEEKISKEKVKNRKTKLKKEEKQKVEKEKKSFLSIFKKKEKLPKEDKKKTKEAETPVTEITKPEETAPVVEETKTTEKKPKKFLFAFKKKEKLSKEERKQIRREKRDRRKYYTDEELIYVKPSLLRRIFSFNTLLIIICIGLVGSAFVLYTYVNGMDILNLKKENSEIENIKVLRPEKIKNENFKEIPYTEIFKQQGEYYVLFYKKEKETVYHGYINTLLDNDYHIYYVDLNKEENKSIYQGNDTGFVINDETLLKVKDSEYEFYVVGKTNILKELRDYLDAISDKIEAEKKKKIEEENAKIKEEISKQLEKDLKMAEKKEKAKKTKKQKEKVQNTTDKKKS